MVRQRASAFGRARAAACKVRRFKRVLGSTVRIVYRCPRTATRLAVLPSAAIEAHLVWHLSHQSVTAREPIARRHTHPVRQPRLVIDFSHEHASFSCAMQSRMLEFAMKNSLPPEVPEKNDTEPASSDTAFDRAPLANRLLSASEVAAFVGCHEESVRRAYLCGQLKRHRFGVRSCRFDPIDVRDWIARGAPTRILREVHRPMRRMGRRRGPGEGGANGCKKDLQA